MTMDPQHYPVDKIKPCQILDLVVQFSMLACQQGILAIDITIRDGYLDWNKRLTKQDPPNFLVTIKPVTFAIGLTSRQWNRLQAKLVIAITKYNNTPNTLDKTFKETAHDNRTLVQAHNRRRTH